MATFLVLYRGETIGAARLLAVTAEPDIVADIAARLLGQLSTDGEAHDPALRSIAEGRRHALRQVLREVRGE